MDDFGPLDGHDVASHLRHPDAFDVATGRAADGVPTIELAVGSDVAVRLVVRTPAGAVLAGPVTFAADAPPTALAW